MQHHSSRRPSAQFQLSEAPPKTRQPQAHHLNHNHHLHQQNHHLIQVNDDLTLATAARSNKAGQNAAAVPLAQRQRRRQQHLQVRQQLDYRHPPFFITFVSIFELVVFVYYALRTDEPISLIGPVPFQSKLIYNPYRRYEVWRYLTYMFIHAGYWHISFNLIVQLLVGVPLELSHKFNPVFIIYLGGVIGGALGNSIADPHSYLAGASSGCYALLAAHISNLIVNWTEIRGACCRLLTLIVFSASDFGTAIYERHFKIGSPAYRTSYGGHVAGALSGLLLGLVFLRNVRVLHWEENVKQWAAGAYIVLVISAIVFSITNSDFFPLPDRRDLVWTSSPFSLDREQ